MSVFPFQFPFPPFSQPVSHPSIHTPYACTITISNTKSLNLYLFSLNNPKQYSMNVGNRKSDVIPNRNAVEMNGGGRRMECCINVLNVKLFNLNKSFHSNINRIWCTYTTEYRHTHTHTHRPRNEGLLMLNGVKPTPSLRCLVNLIGCWTQVSRAARVHTAREEGAHNKFMKIVLMGEIFCKPQYIFNFIIFPFT